MNKSQLIKLTEDIKSNKNFRAGWRYFECDDCGEEWKSKSRDCFSPSGEDCGSCYNFVFPHDYEVDETLNVDKSGNLI